MASKKAETNVNFYHSNEESNVNSTLTEPLEKNSLPHTRKSLLESREKRKIVFAMLLSISISQILYMNITPILPPFIESHFKEQLYPWQMNLVIM